MADKISDALIDEILASTKKYSGGEDESVTYSAEKIDMLLAEIAGGELSEPVTAEADFEPVFAETEAAQEEKPFTVTVPDLPDLPQETAGEFILDSVDSGEETPEASDEVTEPETAEDDGLSSFREGFAKLKKRAKKNRAVKAGIAPIQPADEPAEQPEPQIDADTEPAKAEAEPATVKAEPAEVEIEAETDGQLAFTEDGVEIGAEYTEQEPLSESEAGGETVKSVSGQISIEKTRLFNEVKIRGEYDPTKPHLLGNKVARASTGEAEPLAAPAMGDEKYRQHFMNRPVQNLEKTQEHKLRVEAEPPKTFETPGVIVKGASEVRPNTDGLQPLPTLVSAYQELEKTRVDMPKINKDEIAADNQIVLEGFIEDEKPVVNQPEEQVEAELKVQRDKKVNDFVSKGLLFKQEVDEPSEESPRYHRQRVSVAREYFGPKDKPAVNRIYMNEKKALNVKLIALCLIAGIMAVLAAVAGAENGNFEIYGNNEYIYVAVQLILLLISCALCYRSFICAFKGLRAKVFGIDTVTVLSAFAGIIQCIAGFFFTDRVESVAGLFTAAAVIPMILKTLGELVQNKNDRKNFSVISDESNSLYSVCNIPDEDVANEISRGLMLGNPDIKYSAKPEFLAGFVELSRSAEATGHILKFALPIVFIAALSAGIISQIMLGDFFLAISTFSAVLLMGMPAAASFASAYILRSINRSLNTDKSFINGYNAVEDAVNSNGVIVDACDAFLEGGCNVEGIKLYHKMRIDEAIQYTASVVIASGGVLSDVFMGVIDGKKDLLFPVESLSYEEKLGCSCWIHNHRVLVGNRELLTHHNVETPDRELENKYRALGKNVIYLAIEGKISAMFVVVYKADAEAARYLKVLEKDGVTIFFRTSDANITEDFIEKEFGLPQNVVKIISSVAGDMFVKTKNGEADRLPASIVHDGRAKTMLSALHSAFTINNCVTSSGIVQLIASIIGAVFAAALSLISGSAQVGVWQIIIYQAVWTAILALVPAFRKK